MPDASQHQWGSPIPLLQTTVGGMTFLREAGQTTQGLWFKVILGEFPGGPVIKPSPSNAGGAGLIPGWGARIPHPSGPKNQNIKQKQYCNKLNKDFKKWSTSKKNFKKIIN